MYAFYFNFIIVLLHRKTVKITLSLNYLKLILLHDLSHVNIQYMPIYL